MTGLHVILGVALVAVNAAAGLYGAWCWWRLTSPRAFWWLARTGQALVALEALQGSVLLLAGEELPRLHLVYGLVPLGISFVAEQLRVASAQTVLDQRGLESPQAVGDLPAGEQREIVEAIVRRELGVIAASALVITFLGLRASA